jgi:peptidoglycan hydrolase-like protein with peptidoglycan-binding domain
MPLTRRILLVGGGGLALGGAVAAATGFGGRTGDPPRRPVSSPTTAEVTRATLVDAQEIDGSIGFDEPVGLKYLPAVPEEPSPIASGAPAAPPRPAPLNLVTWLPAAGSTVDRGRTVLRVDERPVVLLLGPLPLYRGLAVGAEGPDVRQLEDNLRALGYRGLTVDARFTGATAEAVRHWQKSLGVAQTGTVAPGDLVYAPGPIRVESLRVRVGDPATGEILRYSGTTRLVKVQLPADRRRYAAVGTAVTVTLPNGTALPGTVRSAGQPADDQAAQGPPALDVEVSIVDQRALGAADGAAVRVRFVIERRENVLTVPVTALVALAEGGYGVEVVDGSRTRYVAVGTGLFAGGRVELTSGEVTAGMRVVVPN